MKFAFFHFNGLVFCERNLSHTVIPCELDLICFNEKNVYFSWDEQRIIAREDEGRNSYFVKMGEYYTALQTKAKDFDMAAHVKNNLELFKSVLNENCGYLQDPEKYNSLCRERIEKMRAERLKSQAEYDQRENERKARAEAHKQEQFKKFQAGGEIEWNDFEDFCAAIGVNIPIKTKGWGRKGVAAISLKTYRLSKGAKSTVIFDILDQVRAKLEPSEEIKEEFDAVVEKLFKLPASEFEQKMSCV